jgi:hypothetical protein
MTITIHASFVVDSLDDLHECLTVIRENEPSSLSFEGDLAMTHDESDAEPDATPYRMGAGPDDEPTVHEWTDPDIEPEPVTHEHNFDRILLGGGFACTICDAVEPDVHEWTELAREGSEPADMDLTPPEGTERPQRDDYTAWAFNGLTNLANDWGMGRREDFMTACQGLAADAWGSRDPFQGLSFTNRQGDA